MQNIEFMNVLRFWQQKLIEKKMKRYATESFVAMFHQVDDDVSKWYDTRYAISFEHFKEYIDNLLQKGYEIVSPYDVVRNDDRKKVLLTFDDAFEGVYYHVFPFLKERNIPFTVFITINKLKEDGYVNLEMLKEMVDNYSGCYVGAHSITHSNLRKLSLKQCEMEIIGSGRELEKFLDKEVDIFAYPYGSLDTVGRRERNIAREKYIVAFGTLQSSILDLGKNNLMYVPRININDEDAIGNVVGGER